MIPRCGPFKTRLTGNLSKPPVIANTPIRTVWLVKHKEIRKIG